MTPQDYKRQIASRYTSLTVDELHKLPKHRLLVQEKHNGEFATQQHGDLIIAGEQVGDRFIAFDIVGSDLPYWDRLNMISQWYECETVETDVADSPDQILEFYKTVMDRGGEGIIVRDTKSTRIWKIKPTLTVDCAVVGFTLSNGLREPASLLLALDRNGFHVVVGSVPVRDRGHAKDLQTHLMPRPCECKVPSGNGTLYQFVIPGLAVEVSCNEVLAGRHPELFWGPDGWKHLGQSDSASLVNPVLNRIRWDKIGDGHDVRWDQIADRIPAPEPEPAPVAGQLLLRNVWTKGDSVRKVLVIQYTDHPEFSPYVACWTDYSPGRADPLKRVVVPFQGLVEACEWAKEMQAAEIKKGWK